MRANRSEGGAKQGWGAEIYVWRGLQQREAASPIIDGALLGELGL